MTSSEPALDVLVEILTISTCGSLFARDLPSEANPYCANSPRRGDCGGEVTPVEECMPRSAVDSLFFSLPLESWERVRSRRDLNIGLRVARHAAVIPKPGSMVDTIAMLDALLKNVVAS